jgi:hypothetical protein
MKKILSIALMLITFSAFAQTSATQSKTGTEQKTPEERATAIASHLEKTLALTADQKAKVHDLALTREQKIDQLREENKDKDRCAWADQRKQVQDEFNTGMQQTLTADQYSKWVAQKEERNKQRANRQQHPNKTPEQRATGFSSHLEKDLGLTPDQKTKVHDLILKREQSIDQLRDKYKGQDPCSWSDERKTVYASFDTGMKATLTPEQYQKWTDLKKQRMEQRKNKKQPNNHQQGK